MVNEAVLKCPACGNMRDSFAAVCECGYTFQNVQSVQSLKDFTEKIEEYDTTEQVYREIRHITAKQRGEHNVLHAHRQQRIQKTPEHAQRGALILSFKIAGHKLTHQKTIARVEHANGHQRIVLALSTLFPPMSAQQRCKGKKPCDDHPIRSVKC